MSKPIEQYCNYMHKEAVNPLAALYIAYTSGEALSGQAMSMGLALAALAGGTGGYVASKLTSPGKRDVKNVQKAFLRDKLQSELSRSNREEQLSQLKEQSLPGAPKPKSLHI